MILGRRGYLIIDETNIPPGASPNKTFEVARLGLGRTHS